MSIASDKPITDRSSDALHRDSSAKTFVDQTLGYDRTDGLVVGVLGPWGSGKSSYINLARPYFTGAGAEILDFNPWMFSGANQLVESFFVELASQLKLRGMDEVGEQMEEYGEAFAGLGWLPVVGTWIERVRGVNKIISKMLKRRKEGITQRRDTLKVALTKAGKPILVVLDDIDRLTTSEIRDVFRLVRLTASFPNLVYVLAFDRGRVEQALEESNVPGRDYLEKILQYSVDLPAIPADTLRRETLNALNESLDDVEWVNDADENSWADKYNGVVAPLVRNMRDVRRYASAAAGTARALQGEIALSDVLTLEAVRVFMPDLFARLHPSAELLTKGGTGIFEGQQASDARQQVLEGVLHELGSYEHIGRSLILNVFPAAAVVVGGSEQHSSWTKTWLVNRAVAHHAVLSLYLERVVGSTLSNFGMAESAFRVMDDPVLFRGAILAAPESERIDVIATLESFESDFTPSQVVPAIVTLLNLSPYVIDKPRGMFGFTKSMILRRIVLRLLRASGGKEEVEAAVTQILPQLESLGAAAEVVSLVGHQPDEGTEIVGEEFADQIETDWLTRVSQATASQIASEEQPVRLLLMAKRWAKPGGATVSLPNDAILTRALFRGARSDSRSQIIGSSKVYVNPKLSWDSLVTLFGEENLAARADLARSVAEDEDADLFELVDKYLSGWRPDED